MNTITTQNPLVNVFPAMIDNISQLAVNARDLHSFLNVGKVFAAWITERIEKYGFVENQDYILTISKTGKRSNVTVKDYHLTLDTAKELAMVENNEQGRKVRRYFIECEKRLIAKRQAISIEQQSAIRQAVAKRCKSESVHYATIYEALKKRFDVPRYTELLACDFDEAMALIASIELNTPQIAHNQSYLTQKDAITLAKVMDYARLYAEFGETIGTEKGQVSVATLYSKNAHDDDDGFFVCYRPKYKQDIDQALTLFRKIAQDSLLN